MSVALRKSPSSNEWVFDGKEGIRPWHNTNLGISPIPTTLDQVNQLFILTNPLKKKAETIWKSCHLKRDLKKFNQKL